MRAHIVVELDSHMDTAQRLGEVVRAGLAVGGDVHVFRATAPHVHERMTVRRGDGSTATSFDMCELYEPARHALRALEAAQVVLSQVAGAAYDQAALMEATTLVNRSVGELAALQIEATS